MLHFACVMNEAFTYRMVVFTSFEDFFPGASDVTSCDERQDEMDASSFMEYFRSQMWLRLAMKNDAGEH